MLTKLRIKNFKAWKDTGDIRMAPLTLLFGANSAGKTSIDQLLLLLKQTAMSPDRQRPLHFGDDRDLVDLGDFQGAVHGHNLEKPIGFELNWRPSKRLEFTDAYTGEHYSTEQIAFSASISADGPRSHVQRFEYALNVGVEEKLSVGMQHKSGAKYQLQAKGYRPIHRQGRKWPLPAPTHFFGFPDEAVAYYQNTGFLADLNLQMSRLLGSIFYVGPLREKPRRIYRWSGETPLHVGERGERAVEAILAGQGRRFNFRRYEDLKTLDEMVAARLQMMGLIHDFHVVPVAKGRKEYEVRVVPRKGTASVLLTDVGFGVSQVLPVIVESFYVQPGSIVIFEQPEIHLHPAVQAELADLFVDAISAREVANPRGIQYIVESHSEHFLRRLQRRIAEGKIESEDAALFFVHTNGAAAQLEELDVDRFGNIKNWPPNFFGDEMADLVARSEAQADRMERSRE